MSDFRVIENPIGTVDLEARFDSEGVMLRRLWKDSQGFRHARVICVDFKQCPLLKALLLGETEGEGEK